MGELSFRFATGTANDHQRSAGGGLQSQFDGRTDKRSQHDRATGAQDISALLARWNRTGPSYSRHIIPGPVVFLPSGAVDVFPLALVAVLTGHHGDFFRSCNLAGLSGICRLFLLQHHVGFEGFLQLVIQLEYRQLQQAYCLL